MPDFYKNMTEPTQILIALSIILLAGFLFTRITKLLHLPNVTGYIISGVVIGPCVLKLVPVNVISHMGFVSDLALSFIAFGIGKFFKKEVLKKTGKNIVIITILEALLAMALVTFASHFIFNLSWKFSLILGAIASATAPASTMMTIKQYQAKGEFVDTLLQVVALDDVVCLLAFGIATAIANTSGKGFSILDVLKPIGLNILAIVLGIAFAFLLGKILTPKRSKDNRLIIVIMALLGLSGICSIMSVSPLLSCMFFSAFYINLTEDKYLFHQMDNLSPPIMLIFFSLSGMSLQLDILLKVGIIGVAYFFIRIIGKYAGAYLGCLITKQPKKIRNNLGLALIPQAGVAIGLAVLGQRLLNEELGSLLSTIILSSSILYELIGPACAKASLHLSGAIPKNTPVVNHDVTNQQETIPVEEILHEEAPSLEENNEEVLSITSNT